MATANPAYSSPRSFGLSDIGKVRSSNQDALLADDALGLWLVADGMGGHRGGATASNLARDVIRERIGQGDSLEAAILAAHDRIRQAQQEDPEVGDMGTTVVAVREHDERYEICWVGDSRAYRYVEADGELACLTEDHNVASILVASGALSPAEAAGHPQRHVLTECLGVTTGSGPRVGRVEGQWRRGDWLLLCSDGLNGELSDERIGKTLGSAPDMAAAVRELVGQSLAEGGRDNVSVLLVMAPSRIRGARRWRWPFRRV